MSNTGVTSPVTSAPVSDAVSSTAVSSQPASSAISSAASSSLPASQVSSIQSSSSSAASASLSSAFSSAVSSASSALSSSSAASASASQASSTAASSSQATSSSPASSTAAASSASSSSQTTFYSTFITYITVSGTGTAVATASAVVGASGGGSSSSQKNVGAIAGGTIGGVVGLVLVALLAWFCIRKRKRESQDLLDEKMFDPSRSARHSVPATGPLDLLAGGAGSHVISPYTYGDDAMSTHTAGMAGAGAGGVGMGAAAAAYGHSNHGHPSGAYGEEQYPPNNAYNNAYNDHGYPDNSLGAPSQQRYSGGWGAAAAAGGAGAAAGYGAMAGAPSSTTHTSEDPYSEPGPRMSPAAIAKQREAQGYGRPVSGSYPQSPPSQSHSRGTSYDYTPAAGPSNAQAGVAPTASAASDYGAGDGTDYDRRRSSAALSNRGSENGEGERRGIVLHEDGGAVPEEGEEDENVELPPQYHSIPSDKVQ